MNPQAEKHYPLAISLILLGMSRVFISYFPDIKLRTDILAASISISGIVIGFLITTQSILFAIDNSSIIKALKQLKVYNKLVSYLMSAIHWSFLVAIINLIGLFIQFKAEEASTSIQLNYSLVWIFTISGMALSCYRIVRLLNRVLMQHK
jgi:type III secretory pathway component EscU